MQRQGESLHSAAVPAAHGKCTIIRTSGSSGMPVRVLVTETMRLNWLALTVREHRWHGLDPSLPFASIRPELVRDDAPEGRDLPDWGAPMALLFRTGAASVLNSRIPIDRQLEWFQRGGRRLICTGACPAPWKLWRG